MVFMALVKLIFKWTNPGPRNIDFLYQWILKRLGRLRLGENPSPFPHVHFLIPFWVLADRQLKYFYGIANVYFYFIAEIFF